MLARLRCWLSGGHNWFKVATAQNRWEYWAYSQVEPDDVWVAKAPLMFCPRCGAFKSTLKRTPEWIIGEFTWHPAHLGPIYERTQEDWNGR